MIFAIRDIVTYVLTFFDVVTETVTAVASRDHTNICSVLNITLFAWRFCIF